MLKMKSLLCVVSAFLIAAPVAQAADLEDFLSRVNVQARADERGFAVRVSAQFDVPEAQVRLVLGKVSAPSDAFMVFQLGNWTRQPIDTVLSTYQKGKGKGWGALAKELGIKPGSREFHALKRGDLYFADGAEGNEHPGHGKGKNKNKHHD